MHFPIRALVRESQRLFVAPAAPLMPISEIGLGGEVEELGECEVWNWDRDWGFEEGCLLL